MWCLRQLVVHQAGVNLQRIVPGLQTTSIHLDQYFSIVHPEVTFTISSIRKFINSPFVLQTRRDTMPEAWKDRPMLQLRGKGTNSGCNRRVLAISLSLATYT